MSRVRWWMLGCLVGGVLGCHDEPTAPAVSETTGATAAAVNVPLLFTQVSAGYSKACGVTIDHRAWCWRVGEWRPHDEPFVAYPVAGGLSWRQVSVSKHDDTHFCGVTTANLAYCWGDNQYGQLGDGTLQSSATPVLLAGGRHYQAIAAGGWFTCALNVSRNPLCWGDNTFAEIGDEDTGNPTTPTRVHTSALFTVVTTGMEHACGVTTDGHAYCWGRDDENELADGTPAHRSDSIPTLVVGTRLYKTIAAGVEHTCALSTSDLAFCWGTGGIGDGTSQVRAVPTRVAGGLKFAQLSTGWDRTCAVTLDRKVYCWGQFITGQVNGSMPLSSSVPVAVGGSYPYIQITTGAQLTCGIRSSGIAICWGTGWGGDGRLHQIHAAM